MRLDYELYTAGAGRRWEFRHLVVHTVWCLSRQRPIMLTAFLSAPPVARLDSARLQRQTAVRKSTKIYMHTRLPENVPGDFFVDSSCINCDTCRWLAKDTFAARRQGKSYVYHQPHMDEEIVLALAASQACPTGSIRTEKPNPLAKFAREQFPMRVDPQLSGIFYNGFTSPKTFGASSYLIQDQVRKSSHTEKYQHSTRCLQMERKRRETHSYQRM